jgi:potassium efflux system protein
VLDEPAPRSWFLGFGVNALDFELRVFVANLADRLPVQSELLEEIARLLAEQGIEHTSPPKAPV